MVAIGSTLFVGQYALLFTGMANGMPPGLASIILQIQVFLTILIAAWRCANGRAAVSSAGASSPSPVSLSSPQRPAAPT